jgi:DNA-binding NtrC family response regulator
MTSSNDRAPHDAGSSDLNGLRILIVEDSWDVATGLKALLEACGADIVGPAATTAETMRLLTERTPDVALVDINLRRGEWSHALIDHLLDQGIRVIVITGYSDVPLAKDKVTAILQKPLREERLLASLRAAANIP